MFNWFTRMFAPTHSTKQETVQLAVIDSNIDDTASLHLVVTSDKDTIERLKELLRADCYGELARKSGDNVVPIHRATMGMASAR